MRKQISEMRSAFFIAEDENQTGTEEKIPDKRPDFTKTLQKTDNRFDFSFLY